MLCGKNVEDLLLDRPNLQAILRASQGESLDHGRLHDVSLWSLGTEKVVQRAQSIQNWQFLSLCIVSSLYLDSINRYDSKSLHALP